MKHSTKKPTPEDAFRMARLKEMRCICCEIRGWISCSQSEVHHLIAGNRRRGHLFTIPLCRWHHRGVPNAGGNKWMTANLGPSLAQGSKPFHAYFGSDDELLEKTNERLAAVDRMMGVA